MAFLAVAFAPAGGSPSPLTCGEGRSAREGGGHAPRLAWLPLPGKRSQLTTSRPTTRRRLARPQTSGATPRSACQNASGDAPSLSEDDGIISWVGGGGDNFFLIPGWQGDG